MHTVNEIKTTDDIHKMFSLAAGGETIMVSRPGVVVLSQEHYIKLQNAAYYNKIEKAIARVQAGDNLITKTMDELEHFTC